MTPESEKEIEKLVKECHARGQKLRVVGSGLSPNGISFTNQTMLNMSLMDKILHVDSEKRQVLTNTMIKREKSALGYYRVGSASVRSSGRDSGRSHSAIWTHSTKLRLHQRTTDWRICSGLLITYPVRGEDCLDQIGAHGTGAKIPPVDEQVISMRMITPGMGTIELSKDDPDPTLFYLTRVGLGCFGVLTEVTLQCVAEHKLVEHTFVSTFREVKKNHARYADRDIGWTQVLRCGG